MSSAPQWDSDGDQDDQTQPQPQIQSRKEPEVKISPKKAEEGVKDDHEPNNKNHSQKKEVSKDQDLDQGSSWDQGKPTEEKKEINSNSQKENKNHAPQRKNSNQKEQTPKPDKGDHDKISYDKFVSGLQGETNGKKEQVQNLNTSNWDSSMNADDNPEAFKKKKNGPDAGQQAKADENKGFTRGDGGFKRANGQSNDQQNGFSGGRGRPFGSGQGGFGRQFGNGQRQGRQGGFGASGGRGGGFDRQGDRGFGDQGGRGGGFGDRGGNDFGGGGGRGGGDRGFGGGRDFGGGGRDFGGGGRDFGGGGRGGGFGGRGGGFGGGRGGRGGRGGFGGGGGFGRRDFNDNNQGNFGRRQFNQEPDRPTQNIISEIQSQPKQTFNIAELSMIDGIPKTVEKSKISPQFRINTTMATEPLGLKCWPTVSIYVKKSKVSLYLSRIHDHNCSILYFPYSNYSMNLYPGNMVNQFPFDYRKKLKQKNKPVGEAYLQRCVGTKNFQVIAFAMITDNDEDSVAKGISSLFDQANRAQKQVLESALIPYSSPMGSLKPIVKVCFQALDKYQKFKEIIISTNDPKTFCQAANQFLEVIQELADNNDLVIQ